MPAAALVYTDDDDRMMHLRMINWGRCMRDRKTGHGYPRSVPFMAFPVHGWTADELDADRIEEILAAFRTSEIGLTEIHASVLKIEYLERFENQMNTVAERASDVRRRYKMPCSERTYGRMLWAARKAVWSFL